MRGLIGSDLFTALRIIKNAGLDSEIKKLSEDIANGKNISQKQAGIEVISACIAGCANANAEKEIWKFLGDLMDEEPKKLASMDINDLMDKLVELTEHIASYDFARFFNQLSVLISQK